MPELLYHYCSSETFHKILTTRSIRLSALSLSNDSMEGKWTQKIFAEVCRDTIEPNATLEIFENASSNLPEAYGALGLCLSEKSDKLSQWRGYADDGKGFCIGFDQTGLELLCRSAMLNALSCELVKVIYPEEEQRTRMRRIVSQLRLLLIGKMQEFRSGVEQDLDKFNREVVEFVFARVDKKLVPDLFAMKNPAFEEEEEWRMVTTYSLAASPSELQYQPSSNKLSPYLTVSFDASASPIAEVYVGPKHSTPIPLIEDFVRRHNVDAKTYLSKATYR